MQATHRADLVRQPAGNADTGIAEVVEQADQPRLQAARERCIADAGDVLHRALADALAYAVAAHRVQFRIEGHRRPGDQAQVVDAPVQAPLDAAAHQPRLSPPTARQAEA